MTVPQVLRDPLNQGPGEPVPVATGHPPAWACCPVGSDKEWSWRRRPRISSSSRIRYQLNHMFFRYLGWNYIGAEGEVQDSGVSWNQTLGIPFLIGLFGLYHLFKKNWQLGLVFLVMFVMMGPILALYQNQQEPQPRERDYFYVGAFYVFSLWIAVGISGLLELIKERMNAGAAMNAASYALVAVFAIAVPGRMLQVGWNEHDRTGNYVAWDYSYNILQSCDLPPMVSPSFPVLLLGLWHSEPPVDPLRRPVGRLAVGPPPPQA